MLAHVYFEINVKNLRKNNVLFIDRIYASVIGKHRITSHIFIKFKHAF